MVILKLDQLLLADVPAVALQPAGYTGSPANDVEQSYFVIFPEGESNLTLETATLQLDGYQQDKIKGF
ncbi:hypothetical protein [Psychromicrobium lacuslunae]|uniref:Uncharacterized protein n=1 Tax=Psychromicrobium lacuslunae TaxID=1618207 RepID=A0A0D4BW26_9MICC|nr:hypothetical protein [Psychromicrobium lacuslunae]AJT40652.1 hypothetical protein UM93_02315 [Psychromicrobium lacuslunae]